MLAPATALRAKYGLTPARRSSRATTETASPFRRLTLALAKSLSWASASMGGGFLEGIQCRSVSKGATQTSSIYHVGCIGVVYWGF